MNSDQAFLSPEQLRQIEIYAEAEQERRRIATRSRRRFFLIALPVLIVVFLIWNAVADQEWGPNASFVCAVLAGGLIPAAFEFDLSIKRWKLKKAILGIQDDFKSSGFNLSINSEGTPRVSMRG